MSADIDFLPSAPTFEVQVVRSPRRTATVEARLVDGVLIVRIPARMSVAEEQKWVRSMTERFARRHAANQIDLMARAKQLARQYQFPVPHSIRWADDIGMRWGSCTTPPGDIRIATAVARFPAWVRDYVIVHELAHLVEPNHSERFWRLVRRFEKTERAEGYLIAKSDGR